MTSRSRATRTGARALLGLALAVAVIAAAATASEEPPGDAARGRDAFTRKHCARCHLSEGREGVGPALEKLRTPQGAYELAGRLWNHVPAMFTVLTHEGIAWPAINAGEMADLMAYLQADPARDPAPDLLKGQLVLVRKGCLKCHTLGGEGARIGPDLAARRADYAPAARWAATMWAHTPRMAVIALERGIMYPRFSGEDMVNLLAFLRSGRGAP